MTDGYISDREFKCSDCYIRNSCDLHPSTCNKQLHVFDAEGLAIHDAKVRADAIDECLTAILTKFTEAESNGNYRFYSVEIKQGIADLLEQLKEQSN